MFNTSCPLFSNFIKYVSNRIFWLITFFPIFKNIFKVENIFLDHKRSVFILPVDGLINDVKLRFYWNLPDLSPKQRVIGSGPSSNAASLWSLSSWWSLEWPRRMHLHLAGINSSISISISTVTVTATTIFSSWSRCVFQPLCVSCIYSYDRKAFRSFSSLFYDPPNGFGAFPDDENSFFVIQSRLFLFLSSFFFFF